MTRPYMPHIFTLQSAFCSDSLPFRFDFVASDSLLLHWLRFRYFYPPNSCLLVGYLVSLISSKRINMWRMCRNSNLTV
jgi:hypothetical protein